MYDRMCRLPITTVPAYSVGRDHSSSIGSYAVTVSVTHKAAALVGIMQCQYVTEGYTCLEDHKPSALAGSGPHQRSDTAMSGQWTETEE